MVSDRENTAARRLLIVGAGIALAWVAACYHRSASRIGQELASSPATRLEPLVADLVPLLAAAGLAGTGQLQNLSAGQASVQKAIAGHLHRPLGSARPEGGWNLPFESDQDFTRDESRRIRTHPGGQAQQASFLERFYLQLAIARQPAALC